MPSEEGPDDEKAEAGQGSQPRESDTETNANDEPAGPESESDTEADQSSGPERTHDHGAEPAPTDNSEFIESLLADEPLGPAPPTVSKQWRYRPALEPGPNADTRQPALEPGPEASNRRPALEPGPDQTHEPQSAAPGTDSHPQKYHSEATPSPRPTPSQDIDEASAPQPESGGGEGVDATGDADPDSTSHASDDGRSERTESSRRHDSRGTATAADSETDQREKTPEGDAGSPPTETESDQPTRRTILALILTGVSFGIAVVLDREVFYRGYGEADYGEQGFGG